MSRQNSNRKVCTYEDFTIFESDFRSISSSWLTDTAVNFGAVWLKNEILGKTDGKVCLIYAFMCEILKYSDPENVDSLLKLAEADSSKWCGFILNDSSDPTVVSGGCHWTLLLHDPVRKTLWQLDPMMDTRIPHCFAFYQRAKHFFQNDYKVLACPKMSVNGSCGVYVLEYLHLLFKFLKAGGSDLTALDLSILNDDYASRRRRFYCDCLNKLAVEQKREPLDCSF